MTVRSRRPLLGVLAVLAMLAVAIPVASEARAVVTRTEAVRSAVVRRPDPAPVRHLPPLDAAATAAIVFSCAALLCGAFLVTHLRRRLRDAGAAWRALLEGAPPVLA